MTTRFDDAWREALVVADRVAAQGFDVVAVRDVLGRAALVVADTTGRPFTGPAREDAAALLRANCAPFVAAEPIIPSSDMFAPESVLSSPNLLILRERDGDAGVGRLAVLERGLVGDAWRAAAATGPDRVASRVTLYGFKGGVGRSTAAVVLARYLADSGRCVLLVDLDLESPGVSAVALGPDDMPDHGIVDFLVEAEVDNVGDLDCVSRSSRLRFHTNGEVWVAPAGGRPRDGYSYIPKLNRAYLDVPAEPGRVFASRIRAAVDYCASAVERQSRKPDVILLDSRSGMHDLAAVAITSLSDWTLLFGVDNGQTWSGYQEVFRQWKADVDLVRRIRERLRMVAAMVPSAHEVEYLASFRDRAQTLFGESLYDEAAPDDPDAYNPPLTDSEAPHSPLPILFTTDLVGRDVTAGTDWLGQDFVTAAFDRFVRGAASLILDGGGGDG